MKFIVSLSSNINNKFKKYLNMNEDKSITDFEQWLQTMKMVARLPGGVPPEFRRKLWLALSEKYLNSKKICWEEEEKKCFNEIYGEDDEELGNQIVKDLHRTGSSLCSGPDGSVNQAKLKKILIGYARWNPEVGYCQGFNMLGAFILQVMDKNEAQSMKVMIFLVEGILPKGYFSGSLGGLQADMAVFRELMTIKLPRLAKHLNKLQRPAQEASFEPPLTNVFTMQWFLTLFCTCLPINCVLRVWDLILTDGNDILLRTALAIWSILEEKVFLIKTADDFYCKMGSLSSELLNSNLVDPNSLIERVIKYGPITNLQKMRSKHLKDIKVWEETKGLQLYYSGNQTDSDDESNNLAVATARGLNRYRRTSGSFPASNISQMSYNKDRIALDISILKKQYEKLRERQRQAHIILTTAVAKQPTNTSLATSLNVDQLLIGRTAITANKGRKIGPPPGAIPPARKPTSTTTSKQYKKYEISKSTENDNRKKNIKWKTEHNEVNMPSFTDHQDKHQSAKESESSSYSDDNSDDSSTSTSLCDEISDNQELGFSSLEYSSISPKTESDFETINFNAENVALNTLDADQNLDFISTISNSVSEKKLTDNTTENELDAVIREENSFVKDDQQCEKIDYLDFDDTVVKEIESSMYIGANDHHTSRKDSPYTSSSNYSTCTSSTSDHQTIDDAPNQISAAKITSTSQLSPVADISNYLGISSISPLKSPSFHFGYLNLTPLVTKSENEDYDYERKFDITEQGVTNEYFERINVERPKHLDLSYSSIIKTEEFQNEKVEIFPESSSNSFYNKISTSTKDESILIPDSSTENFSHTNLIFDSQKPYFDKTSIPNDEITFKNQTSENQNLLLLGREDKIKDTQDNTKKDEKLLGSNCINIYTENSFLFSNQNLENVDDIQSTLHTETISFKDRNENEPSPSDKVLKIIEENSLILHKILKKTIPDYSPVQTKMPLFDNITTTIADTSYMTTSTSSTAAISVTTDIQEQQNSLVSLEEEISYKNEITLNDSNDSYKFSFDNTISTESKSFEINEYLKSNNDPSSNNKSVKIDGDDDNGKNDFIDFIDRPYRSRAINFQNVCLRTDDNITDQLESIKNTIKSIDSLCEEKTSSYKKEKCQKYIESLFENQNQNNTISIKNQNITTVATAYIELDNDIKMSDNYRMKSLEVDNKNYEIDNYSLYPERFARNSKRALSPRYRKDEDREEYESRLGRDRNNELDNSPPSSKFSECSKLNENKINDVISDVMSDEINLLSINGNSKSLTNINLETKSALKSSSSIAYTLEKPKIRHATVTSTMYDRFLSQKLEEKMMNKNYVEIKEPKITVTTTDRDNDYITDAAEISSRERLPNYKSFSKSRDEISSLINQNSLSLDPLDFHKKVFLDIYTNDSSNMKSCDNIVYKLRSESDSSVSSFSTTTAKTSEIEEITTATGAAAQKQSLHKSLELLNVDIKLEKIKNSNEDLMKS